jgi:RNAse (barnase) inhibitor barstar
MVLIKKNIIFNSINKVSITDKDFCAEIKSGIKTAEEIFKIYQEKLFIPDYFGHNWDALEECLQDFYWIDKYKIILIHEEIPNLPEQDFNVFIDILDTAQRFWLNRPKHKLVVIMPE